MKHLEPACECNDGWSGYRCMDKSLDGYYNVLVLSKNNPSTTSSTTTTTTAATTTTTSTTAFATAERYRSKLNKSDVRKMPVSKCPQHYDADYCLNGGKCVMFQQGYSFMCICKYPYVGLRCEEKGVESDYNKGLNRRRRRVLVFAPNRKHPVYYQPRSTTNTHQNN